MSKPLKVLIVEDSEDDALLVIRELRHGGYEPDFEIVETAEAMRSALGNRTWDLVISDYSLPAFNAFAALNLVIESGLDLPFIIVSGTIGEETAVAAMRAGAHDYLMKGNLARLSAAVERELREAGLRREYSKVEEALRESEEKYRSLVESTQDSIYVVNRNCTYLFMNKRHLSRLDVPEDNATGKTYREFHSASDTQEFIKKVEDVFASDAPQQHEHESHRDGKHFLRTLSPIIGPDGRTEAVTVVFNKHH